MGLYYVNEAAFELPDIGLADRTVHQLDASLPESDGVALRIPRAPLPAGKALADVVAENVRRAERQLSAHAVVFRREAEIAGCPAIEIAVEWRGEVGMVYTRQAHLDVGGTWLVFAGNAPQEDRAACDELLDRALATFRVRD
jgi:hypothetical protein